jgi:flavin-dependent dehydrogenase
VSDDGSGEGSGSTAQPSPSPFARIRREPRRRAVALAVVVVLGLALASVHWLALVAAGAAASLVAPTARRGVAYALSVGALALVAFAVSLGPSAASLPEMTPVVYVAVAAVFGLPLLGSLARGIV